MYNFLKKNISSLLPKSVLFKNELFLRYFYGIFYLGKTHQCNICNHKLRAFVSIEGKGICPFCGSLARTRRLWKQLNNDNSLYGRLLHFSPSRSLYRKLKKHNNIQYFSSDYEGEFLADYTFDITKIEQPNESFDIIICYHILEHINNDMKAIKELYRVLNLSGKIYLQTPFKKGEIYEDFSIKDPEMRTAHFGQEDHVRIYSVNGLKNRLEKVGFKVFVKSFDRSTADFYFGYKSPETILILSK